MRKVLKNLFVGVFLAGLLFPSGTLLRAAGVTGYGLDKTVGEISTTNPGAVTYVDPATKIGTIIGYLLSFVGLIFLILVIYGGYQWMVAGGNEEEVNKAKALFTQAVFGLIIISTAYLLVNFVSNVVFSPTTSVTP